MQLSNSACTWLARLGVCVVASAAPGCGDDHADEVEDAARTWRSQDPADYVFVYGRGCYCAEDYTRPARVVVQSGKAVSATFAGGSPTPSERAVTIDELFDELHDFAVKDPVKFSLHTNREWGYPERFSGELSEDTTDDTKTLSVTCFAEGHDEASCALDSD